MKKTASINSSEFFLKNKAPYNSFIWLGKNFIEVAVTDNKSQKIEAIQSFKKEVGNITRDEALSVFQLPDVKNATQIFVGLESDKFTLIPDSLYNPTKASHYLESIFELDTNETVATQKVVPTKCQSVFSLKKGTQDLLTQHLNNVKILHAPSSLLIAYQQMLPPQKEYFSFIRVNEDDVIITVFKNKALQLHQSYNIQSIADALYHFLNALENLGIDKTKSFACLLGRHSNLEELNDILSKNIEFVKIANRLPTLQYTDEVFSQPSHRFFNLFALILCA